MALEPPSIFPVRVGLVLGSAPPGLVLRRRAVHCTTKPPASLKLVPTHPLTLFGLTAVACWVVGVDRSLRRVHPRRRAEVSPWPPERIRPDLCHKGRPTPRHERPSWRVGAKLDARLRIVRAGRRGSRRRGAASCHAAS